MPLYSNRQWRKRGISSFYRQVTSDGYTGDLPLRSSDTFPEGEEVQEFESLSRGFGVTTSTGSWL